MQRDPDSPGARRIARFRERQRLGLRVVSVELRQSDIDALVRRNWLDPQSRSDLRAVRRAMYGFCSDYLGGPNGPPKPYKVRPPL